MKILHFNKYNNKNKNNKKKIRKKNFTGNSNNNLCQYKAKTYQIIITLINMSVKMKMIST